jgi:hypothetical protein
MICSVCGRKCYATAKSLDGNNGGIYSTYIAVADCCGAKILQSVYDKEGDFIHEEKNVIYSTLD